jgi:hypothetical protein
MERVSRGILALSAGTHASYLQHTGKSEPTLLTFVTGKNWPICRENKTMGAAGFEPATSRV